MPCSVNSTDVGQQTWPWSALCNWLISSTSTICISCHVLPTHQKSTHGRLSVFLSLRMVGFTRTWHRLDLEPSFLEDHLKFGGSCGTPDTGNDQSTESRVTKR